MNNTPARRLQFSLVNISAAKLRNMTLSMMMLMVHRHSRRHVAFAWTWRILVPRRLSGHRGIDLIDDGACRMFVPARIAIVAHGKPLAHLHHATRDPRYRSQIALPTADYGKTREPGRLRPRCRYWRHQCPLRRPEIMREAFGQEAVAAARHRLREDEADVVRLKQRAESRLRAQQIAFDRPGV